MGDKLWDLIVVGSGPAGLAAARAAGERGLDVALLDRSGAPRSRLGSGVMSSFAAGLVTDRFGLDLSEMLIEPRELRGLRLHLSPKHSYEVGLGQQAHVVDRSKMESSLLRACTVTHVRRCEVGELLEGPHEVRVRGVVEGRPFTPRARYVIDASGRESVGLPARSGRLRRSDELASPRFVGRVLLEAHVSDCGWHELLVGRDFVARFTSGPGGVVAEMELRSSSLWRSRWATVVQFLTGPREIAIEREMYSSFGWLQGPVGPALGSARVLRVGDAAGLVGLLGYGIGSALESGMAAGAAAASSSEGASVAYRGALSGLVARRRREATRGAARRLEWRPIEGAPTLRAMLRTVPFMLRGGATRTLRRSVERWLD